MNVSQGSLTYTLIQFTPTDAFVCVLTPQRSEIVTVNSRLTDAFNSGHMQYNRQCMMYQLIRIMKPLNSGHPSVPDNRHCSCSQMNFHEQHSL